MLAKFEPITISAGIATIAMGVAAYKITNRHDKVNGYSKNRKK
jgi:hypothetical protein